MATQTATLTSAKQTELHDALVDVAYRINQAAVGGPGRNLAITVVTDTTGVLTFNVPAHGGDPAYSKAITCSVA